MIDMGPLGYHRPDKGDDVYLPDCAARTVARRSADWRLEQWCSLPNVCLIAGCDGTDIDQRGPIWVRNGDHVLMLKACTEHWEGIYQVLGVQASWERTDGARG